MAAGLDSLGVVELRNAISDAFGVVMTATSALDFPTLDALATHLAAQLSAPDIVSHSGGSWKARAHTERNIGTQSKALEPIVPADITAQLVKVVEDVLGMVVAPEQPLMEARCIGQLLPQFIFHKSPGKGDACSV